jgi:hypothetical protein
LLKNGHLLRFPHPSSLRRTTKYASLLRISGALHLALFEQPGKDDFFSSVLGPQGLIADFRFQIAPACRQAGTKKIYLRSEIGRPLALVTGHERRPKLHLRTV